MRVSSFKACSAVGCPDKRRCRTAYRPVMQCACITVHTYCINKIIVYTCLNSGEEMRQALATKFKVPSRCQVCGVGDFTPAPALQCKRPWLCSLAWLAVCIDSTWINICRLQCWRGKGRGAFERLSVQTNITPHRQATSNCVAVVYTVHTVNKCTSKLLPGSTETRTGEVRWDGCGRCLVWSRCVCTRPWGAAFELLACICMHGACLKGRCGPVFQTQGPTRQMASNTPPRPSQLLVLCNTAHPKTFTYSFPAHAAPHVLLCAFHPLAGDTPTAIN